MTFEPRRISGFNEIAASYDLVLCDVWGVVHNGVAAHAGAINALGAFRKQGGLVFLITNAPRRRRSVLRQLSGLGVPGESFDGVVTSGDVTRELIKHAPRKLFHLGPGKDRNLFEDIDCELVGESDAEGVVCSGLFDDRTESPEDYAAMLASLRQRDLPFICANPDIVVEMGHKLVYCAGALARDYAALGGRTLIAGKPYPPIYDTAISEAEALAGSKFELRRILAIGDGISTDIAGASRYGIDALFVSAGIHTAEYGPANAPDAVKLAAFLAAEGAKPVAWLPRLVW